MIIVRTPLRISYFGGGTDFPEWYKNFYEGGMTLCAAIDKYCYINIRYLNDYYDHKYRIRYYKNEEKNRIDLILMTKNLRFLLFLGHDMYFRRALL
jgi:D-glycero-alpha-D-manno-heptose-7-phosphate kinase